MAIDLKVFCDPDSQRYDLSTPYVQNGWKYATDTRVAVRVEARGEPDTVSERKLPTASVLNWMTPAQIADATWHKLPEIPPEKKEKCEDCEGHGHYTKPNGEPVMCQGQFVWCESCDGSGETVKWQRVPFESVILRDDILRKIATLPNVEICVHPKQSMTVGIRFDGGIGLASTMIKGADR